MRPFSIKNICYASLAAFCLLSACGPQINPALRGPVNTAFNAQAREPLSAIMGDAPNFAASSNGSLLAVVSGPHGRGATPGALVEMYYPDLGEDHLWDAYSGVHYNGRLWWLHQFKLESQEVLPGSDIVVSRFSSPDGRLLAETQDMVLKDQHVLVRQLTLSNRSAEPISDLRGFFYENMTINVFPTGDECAYLPEAGAIHHYENNVHFAVGLDQPPTQFQCGGIKNFITRARDAMHDAEDGQLNGNPRASAFAGLGVNGALSADFQPLGPGQSVSSLSYIAAGQSQQEAVASLQQVRQRPWSELVQQNRSHWQQYLGISQRPPGLSAEEQAVYDRALIVMKQHSAPTGAHIAAPTSTSPPYRFSWPRDGSFIALAHLLTGHAPETRAFLDFMARAQKPNGSWAINYHTNGQAFYDFGDRQNEHDQVGTIPWMMVEYARRSGDWPWLQQHWPTIQKACEYLLRYSDSQTGLLGPTRDLWELSTTDTWTYSNAAGYAGFKAGAEAARRVGDAASAARYEQAAERLKAGIHQYLWHEQGGYYARGYNLDSRRRDPKVEAANLALVYPFKVFEAQDPRMQQMARKILTDLSSPQGGIRRYTDDRYYDGQPWPVTTEWLAIYYALAGDTERARQLHAVSTRYALSTGSQQLGEQFDEQRGIWVSATPLTWSGAKYVLAALALNGQF